MTEPQTDPEQGSAPRGEPDAAPASQPAPQPAARDHPPAAPPELDDAAFAEAAEAYEAGLAAEAAGDREAAVAAFRRTLALDAADRAGIALRLARLGAAPMPERAPRAYVEMLFDEHAAAFDARLVEDLGYRVPQLLRARLDPLLPPGPVPRALDLGCGTGLVGLAFADRVAEMTGIDLSVGMLHHAWARGVYAALMVGDAAEVLRARARKGMPPANLILAADVLIYIGAIEPLMAACAGCLAPGGLLALSTESGAVADRPGALYALGEGVRYSHAPAYLAAAMAGAGLELVALDPVTVRREDDHPVPGHIAVARRPG